MKTMIVMAGVMAALAGTLPLAAQAAPDDAPAPARCDAGPVDKVFLKAVWHIYACSDGSLLAEAGTNPPAVVFVHVFEGQVEAVAADGMADTAEVTAARAALSAMSPGDLFVLAGQARAVKPAS